MLTDKMTMLMDGCMMLKMPMLQMTMLRMILKMTVLKKTLRMRMTSTLDQGSYKPALCAAWKCLPNRPFTTPPKTKASLNVLLQNTKENTETLN